MSKSEPTFTMPRQLAQDIVDYLEDRPHREVRGLIDRILQCNPRPPVALPPLKEKKSERIEEAQEPKPVRE